MTFQRIDAELAPDTVTGVMELIQGVEEKLPFLVGLTQKERKTFAKMSRKLVDFVNRSLMYARNNPQFVPPYINHGLMDKDYEMVEALRRIYVTFGGIYENIKDTLNVVESQLYAMARVFYKSVKAAASENSGDAEVIAKDLAFHYKRGVTGKGAESVEESGTKEEVLKT